MNTARTILATTAAMAMIATTPLAHAGALTKQGPRIAVLPFKVTANLSWSRGYINPKGLGEVISDTLVTELARRKVNLIERNRIDDVIREQNFGKSGRVDERTAAKIGKILGVDFLLYGTVSEWSIKEQNIGGSGLGGFLGQSVNVKATNAFVRIEARMVNAKTAEIEKATSAEGQGSQTSFNMGDWLQGFSLQNNEWWEGLIGRATRTAIQRLATELGTGNVEAARVLAISGKDVIVDAGQDAGIQVGDEFVIERSKGQVKDKNGKVIFEDREQIAVVKAIAVQAAGAKLKVVSMSRGVQIQTGDVLMPKTN